MTYDSMSVLLFPIQHKPFSVTLNHQLLSTIHQNHQLSGGFYHLSVNLVFPIDIVQKILEIGHHVWGRYNHSHLAKTTEPAIELVTDCNLCGDNEMLIIVRTIEHFGASAKAINHGVQKVVGESQADSFLLTTEHTKVLLGVAFHVDLGELHVALSWLVQDLNTLHTIQAISNGVIPFAVPGKHIVIAIIDTFK